MDVCMHVILSPLTDRRALLMLRWVMSTLYFYFVFLYFLTKNLAKTQLLYLFPEGYHQLSDCLWLWLLHSFLLIPGKFLSTSLQRTAHAKNRTSTPNELRYILELIAVHVIATYGTRKIELQLHPTRTSTQKRKERGEKETRVKRPDTKKARARLALSLSIPLPFFFFHCENSR